MISSVLARAWAQFPVVVLTGARQTGKTTLARAFLPKADYVTLDSPSEAETARLNPEAFFQGRTHPLIIDEVQYEPGLLRQIKRLVDRDRSPGRYFVTGSQSFGLMAGVTESLAGRCAVLTLPPLALPELAEPPTLPVIDRFLWRGGYPELWDKPSLERNLWQGSYVTTCLERDVRNLLNVGNLRDFDRFLRAAALRTGQLLSYADLARDVGISPQTAKAWISVLETSQLIFLLEPYHRQRTKRLVKSPKLYFVDTGLLTYLMGFSQPAELPGHALWGAIWENLVVSEVRKRFLTAGARPPLWFWRTSSGDEIDLLVEIAPERFIAIECKAAERVEPQALKALRPLQAEYGDGSVKRAWVACRTTKSYPLVQGGAISAGSLPSVLKHLSDDFGW